MMKNETIDKESKSRLTNQIGGMMNQKGGVRNYGLMWWQGGLASPENEVTVAIKIRIIVLKVVARVGMGRFASLRRPSKIV